MTDNGPAINPITGTYYDDAISQELANMTDEEKEREAERLFVLFDRLNKTGVMKVDLERTAQMGMNG
jgi:hypothetical protein